MSLPNPENPYSFNEFLEWRNKVDFYADDPFLQKLAAHYAQNEFPAVDKAARLLSKKASFRWNEFACAASIPDRRPYLVNFDAHGNRIDRIVRPMETLLMEKEIFSEALFSEKTSPWERVIKMFLIAENSEACMVCPLTCTEGMAALLRRFADTAELKSALTHITDGIDGDFAIGAQYLSEIQGGSDVAANLLEAAPDGEHFRLYGKKFFCSATHADYSVVTAKPRGSEKVAVFIVPSWLPGNKEREIRNGFTIDRIKWKMGTSELTTGEITYNGAVAYPAGPLDRGIANAVGIVLTYSRMTIALGGAAGLVRASREASRYAEFRKAFGVRLVDFPMVRQDLETIADAAKRSAVGCFAVYDEFFKTPGGLEGGLGKSEAVEAKKRRFRLRQLIMLQKITVAQDSVDITRKAMSVLGGHGVMEDFSILPRLYRDAAVNELWEGPRNVLLTQMHRDFKRASAWYPPAAFVRDMLKGADREMISDFAQEISDLTAPDDLFGPDAEELSLRWDCFCEDLFHSWQALKLDMIESLPSKM